LTFDDGPWEDTPAVLDLLAQYRVKATFCMVGRQVAAHAALVRRMVAEGHTLCNHTWSHDEMLRNRPADRIRAELQQTNDAIHAVVPGAVIGYFRAPGGNFSPQIVSITASMGMTSIYWSVDPQDWRGPGVQSIITNVLTYTRPGSIVLLHDGAGPQTIAALRTILPDLARRYTLTALPDADPRETSNLGISPAVDQVGAADRCPRPGTIAPPLQHRVRATQPQAQLRTPVDTSGPRGPARHESSRRPFAPRSRC
jgi:peptidoglycan/xylan/chitin deacetylase (PgdA/CDA1 family)